MTHNRYNDPFTRDVVMMKEDKKKKEQRKEGGKEQAAIKNRLQEAGKCGMWDCGRAEVPRPRPRSTVPLDFN